MEYDTRTYFEEHESDSVKGFTIVNVTDGGYDLAEKWNKDDGESTWLTYDITEEALIARVEAGKCEPKAELSDKQYDQVCDMINYDAFEEKVTA